MSRNSEASATDPAAVHPRLPCPQCQGERVFRSHRRSRTENLLSWLNYYPYRCHACGHRFTVKSAAGSPGEKGGREDPRPEARKRRTRRLMRTVVIGAVCVVVFLIFLYYLIQPSAD